MKESSPQTTDLVARLRADRAGLAVDVACNLDDLCLEAADEIVSLRAWKLEAADQIVLLTREIVRLQP